MCTCLYCVPGWCNEWTCDRTDCGGCGPDRGCKWSPPPPPANPGFCGSRYQNCLISQCCANPEVDACFGRVGRVFAMCRPADTPCGGEADDWNCPLASPRPPSLPSPPSPPPPPAPPPCSDNFKSCWLAVGTGQSGCCNSPSFGCYRRRDKRYAQCRPLPLMSKGVRQRCADDGAWLCPGWSDPPPAPPSAPAPAPPPRAPSPSPLPTLPPPPLVAMYKNCWDRIRSEPVGCESPVLVGEDAFNFACYKRKGRQYAQCRPLPSDGPCVSDDTWLCSQAPPPTPPASPHPPEVPPTPARPEPKPSPFPPFRPNMAPLPPLPHQPPAPTPVMGVPRLAGGSNPSLASVAPSTMHGDNSSHPSGSMGEMSNTESIKAAQDPNEPGTALVICLLLAPALAVLATHLRSRCRGSSGGEAEDHSHLPATPVMEVDASASETNVAERVQKKRTKRPAATGKKTRHGQRARKGHMKLPSTDVDELDGSGILEDPPPLQLELQPEGLAEGVEDAWERGPVADARPLL